MTSQRMLSVTLKGLERGPAGIRVVEPTRGRVWPRTAGARPQRALEATGAWAFEHYEEAWRRYDKREG